MPHSRVSPPRRKPVAKAESRYTVALTPGVASQVERYARTADTSMSKAIAAFVRLGLQGQESRKREFFRKLKANLSEGNPAQEDPAQQDRLVDEFRNLILGL